MEQIENAEYFSIVVGFFGLGFIAAFSTNSLGAFFAWGMIGGILFGQLHEPIVNSILERLELWND